MNKSLPNINILPLYEVHLKAMNKKIKYSPFNVEQEKAIIVALENDNLDEIVLNYENVLKTCLKENSDWWDDISVVDYITLIVNIRAKSKGEDLSLRIKECDKCKKEFETTINIEDAIKYENEDNLKDIVKITDDLSLEIKPLNYKFLYGLDKLTNEMDMYIHTAIHSISKVFWQNNIFIASPEELKEKIIKNLRRYDLEKIFKEYKKLISTFLEINVKCPFCEHEKKEIIRNFLKSLT